MSKILQNKVAVITGSGSGIGKATAIAMARQGAKIIVNGTTEEKINTTVNEIRTEGNSAVSFLGDISNFSTAEQLIKSAIDNFGKIDILVNNAGIAANAAIADFPEKDWDSVIAVNLKGTFNCIRHSAPHMIRQRWGRIINVSSGARLGMPFSFSYAASKAGIIGLTRTAALELAPHGITCNAFQPTAATQFTLNAFAQSAFKNAFQDGLLDKTTYDILSNPPSPDTVPPLVIYLSTDEAHDVNGEVFDILGNTISLWAPPHLKFSAYSKEGWSYEEIGKAITNALPKVS